MNFLHVIIMITIGLLLKVLVITNRDYSERLKKATIILVMSILVITGILTLKRPLLNILSDDTFDYTMVSVNAVETGVLTSLVGSEEEREILAVLEQCKVGYALKYYSKSNTQSDTVLIVQFVKDSEYVNFEINDDNLIIYNDKYYKLRDSTILNDLRDIVTESINTMKW